MYEIIKHAHSGIRWIVLITLILAIVNAFTKWQSGKEWTKGDQQKNLFAMASAHIQLLLGLALMFVVKSPKVHFTKEAMKEPITRFFAVEHFSMMILSIIFITIGYSLSKRASTDISKFKKTFFFYLIALLIILYAIPWPFQSYGASWI